MNIPLFNRASLDRSSLNRDPGWHKASPLPLAIRIAWGSVLLAAPGPALRMMGGSDEGRTPRRVMRILGARHLLEAAAEWRFGGPAREIGIGVDAIHAVVDVGFAGVDARWRRAALTDAGIAGGFVGLGLVTG